MKRGRSDNICRNWVPVIAHEDPDTGDYIYECELPKDGERVLILYHDTVFIDTCEIDKGMYLTASGNEYGERVEAWSPLPDPDEIRTYLDLD